MIGTLDPEIECVELEILAWLDEDDSFDAGAAVIELFFGFDVDFDFFVVGVRISHYNYNDSNTGFSLNVFYDYFLWIEILVIIEFYSFRFYNIVDRHNGRFSWEKSTL